MNPLLNQIRSNTKDFFTGARNTVLSFFDDGTKERKNWQLVSRIHRVACEGFFVFALADALDSLKKSIISLKKSDPSSFSCSLIRAGKSFVKAYIFWEMGTVASNFEQFASGRAAALAFNQKTLGNRVWSLMDNTVFHRVIVQTGYAKSVKSFINKITG